MKLLLIRHAEAKRDGSADLGLTPKGQAQAWCLGQALNRGGELADGAILLASPLRRARQTAMAIVNETRSEGLDIVTESDLTEMGEGLPGDEVETFDEFRRRIGGWLDRIALKYQGHRLIAVTHAGVIVATLLDRFAVPRPGSGARLDPAYASLTEWRVQKGVWTLASYNCFPTGLLVEFD